jgi:hypothetical protein
LASRTTDQIFSHRIQPPERMPTRIIMQ